MFGPVPVITTEAHLALAGARVHSNNTAEMSAFVEALSFLGPSGPVARDELSWCLLGQNSCSHARAAWTLLPTVIAESSAQATIYQATRLQSRGESWKRVRRPRCCTGCVWIGVEP